METNKRVFVSYSWDSKEHQEWVLYLVNELRKKGLFVEVDVFETQTKSVNLNQMMVEKVRDSDFVVIVLTESYARKADQFIGGVGFESLLTLPYLMDNPEKLVLIMRHKGEFSRVFPFHLKGRHAIDFSNDREYDEKLTELIYRLHQKPFYYVEPVGEIPTLEPKKPSRIVQVDEQRSRQTEWDFSDITIPSLKRITDRDIEKFMKDSFNQLIQLFNRLFKKVQASNPNFEFDHDEIEKYKSTFQLYIDGEHIHGMKIWYGDSIGRSTINFSYGRHLSRTDNSMNEIIVHEINKNNKLHLKMTMNMFGNRDVSTPEEIVREVWNNNISQVLK
ncbi:toll/interleukin-1 receptor domain-containing protein [Gottfriedia sp. NPDC057991]|uniref:toll/interleukin-1 receptor domain-containing protein n=1 Tax=Gottfriedia sp. NPDC057991 TaxID=3346298 RepID=UPI0036DE97E0